MAVYVDDFLFPADIPNGRVIHSSNWSHLFNDGPDQELHEFAQRLGLRREYFQHPGEWHRHYDVTQGKRWQAIRLGAIEVTSHEGTKILRGRDERERLDYDAGVAFRNGDLDKARAIMAKAQLEHPEQHDHWAARLEAVAAKESRPTPSPLPEPGVHRDSGQTTVGRFGTFPRSPEPDAPHPCPGCTTVTEHDGRTATSGPKIEQHQDVCQGCQVEASVQGRDMPAHPQIPADRSDPAKACGKCGTPGVGPGGIICPPCREELQAHISPAKGPAVTASERDEVEAGQ